jgi:hypothetical protein
LWSAGVPACGVRERRRDAAAPAAETASGEAADSRRPGNGALCGVPMSPEQIEKLMEAMNRVEVVRVVKKDRDHSQPDS